MSRKLSPDPADRLGVFKRLADVPDRYRLYHHAGAYADRDVWAEYVEETELYERHSSQTYRNATERAITSWKEHMEDRGRHHALAAPTDVETWCAGLLAERSDQSVYSKYWTRLAEFYDWLRWHTEYPHVYDPILMAAAEFPEGSAGTVWDEKIRKGTRDQ